MSRCSSTVREVHLYLKLISPTENTPPHIFRIKLCLPLAISLLMLPKDQSHAVTESHPSHTTNIVPFVNLTNQTFNRYIQIMNVYLRVKITVVHHWSQASFCKSKSRSSAFYQQRNFRSSLPNCTGSHQCPSLFT